MRVAIIGLGSIGLRHAKNILALGGHKLALYDINAGKLAQAAVSLEASDKLRDVAALTINIDALWKWKPKAVLICTPPDSHVKLAHDAITRGIPAFVEKPITNCLGDNVVWLAELAERSGVITMVACNFRFHVGPMTIKRWLEEKAIGDVLCARVYSGSYLPEWVPERDYKTSYSASTGVILDVGSHAIDLLINMFGNAELKGSQWLAATSIGLTCDGMADLLLKHQGGEMTSAHISFIERNYQMALEVQGTNGTLFWDWTIDSIKSLGNNGQIKETITYNREEEMNAMYSRELAHLFHSVEGRSPTCNPISQAVKTLSLLLQAKGG